MYYQNRIQKVFVNQSTIILLDLKIFFFHKVVMRSLNKVGFYLCINIIAITVTCFTLTTIDWEGKSQLSFCS